MADIEYLGRPRTLYRYRSRRGKPGQRSFEQELEALEERYIWGAKPSTLNDPSDGRFLYTQALEDHSVGKRFIERVSDRVEKLGVAAFCEISTHALMWAHYADSYKGICIAYDLDSLLQHMGEDIIFTRVSYSDRETKLTQVRSNISTVAKRVLSRKTRAWLYEREWRMISPRPGKQSYKRECIKRVILGFNVLDHNRKVIEKRLSNAKIDVETLNRNRLIMSL